jgi:hypothetical protein
MPPPRDYYKCFEWKEGGKAAACVHCRNPNDARYKRAGCRERKPKLAAGEAGSSSAHDASSVPLAAAPAPAPAAVPAASADGSAQRPVDAPEEELLCLVPAHALGGPLQPGPPVPAVSTAADLSYSWEALAADEDAERSDVGVECWRATRDGGFERGMEHHLEEFYRERRREERRSQREAPRPPGERKRKATVLLNYGEGDLSGHQTRDQAVGTRTGQGTPHISPPPHTPTPTHTLICVQVPRSDRRTSDDPHSHIYELVPANAPGGGGDEIPLESFITEAGLEFSREFRDTCHLSTESYLAITAHNLSNYTK